MVGLDMLSMGKALEAIPGLDRLVNSAAAETAARFLKNIRVNDIRTAFGKDGFAGWFKKRIEAKQLRYLNKEKSAALSEHIPGHQLPSVIAAQRSSGQKITWGNEVVKPDYSGGNTYFQSAPPDSTDFEKWSDGLNVWTQEEISSSQSRREKAETLKLVAQKIHAENGKAVKSDVERLEKENKELLKRLQKIEGAKA